MQLEPWRNRSAGVELLKPAGEDLNWHQSAGQNCNDENATVLGECPLSGKPDMKADIGKCPLLTLNNNISAELRVGWLEARYAVACRGLKGCLFIDRFQ